MKNRAFLFSCAYGFDHTFSLIKYDVTNVLFTFSGESGPMMGCNITCEFGFQSDREGCPYCE